MESWEDFARDAELVAEHESAVGVFKLNQADQPIVFLSFKTDARHIVYPFTIDQARLLFVKLNAKIAEAEQLEDET